MKINEVVEIIRENFINNWDGYNPEELEFILLENESYKLEFISSFGGEGKGDIRWEIYKLTDKISNKEIFIRFNGRYDSWNGTDWCYDPQLVIPYEKVIIDYKVIDYA